jgi:hypothetical protein
VTLEGPMSHYVTNGGYVNCVRFDSQSKTAWTSTAMSSRLIILLRPRGHRLVQHAKIMRSGHRAHRSVYRGSHNKQQLISYTVLVLTTDYFL